MIDLKYLREHRQAVREGAAKKGVSLDVDAILALDTEHRELTQTIERLRAEMNMQSKMIGTLRGGEKNDAIEKTYSTKTGLKKAEADLAPIEARLTETLYTIPNLPFDNVPVGDDETGNTILTENGKKQPFSFQPKAYDELAHALDLIDTDRAAKTSGTRFGYLKGPLAILEWGIVLFTMRRLSDNAWLKRVAKDVPPTPFIPMVPPVMIRPEIFRAMGKLDPGQEEERYFLNKDNLYLVGSAEHSIGPYYAEETLDEKALPVRFIGFSTCFRREAGSYGKDTKGIIRVHQFDKLEMFSYAHPDRSRDEHRFFLAVQEALMQELELPYRVMAICTGDMVWTDAEQFDLETWLPGQRNGKGEYRETHSTSNSTDFQARRLNTRFRSSKGKTAFVHTINGTAFAIGRTLVAILENYQTANGDIAIPEVLQPFCGFSSITKTGSETHGD